MLRTYRHMKPINTSVFFKAPRFFSNSGHSNNQQEKEVPKKEKLKRIFKGFGDNIVSSYSRSSIYHYRRAIKAERLLKRLEKHVIHVGINADNGEIISKKAITGEESKDFSRIIATNINADVNWQRTVVDNLTRLLIGVFGALILYRYSRHIDRREKELMDKEKNLEKRNVELKEMRASIEATAESLREEVRTEFEQEISDLEKKISEKEEAINDIAVIAQSMYNFYYPNYKKAEQKIVILEKYVLELCNEDKDCVEKYHRGIEQVEKKLNEDYTPAESEEAQQQEIAQLTRNGL